MLMSLINDMIFAYKVCTSSHSIYYNVNTMKIGVLLFGGIPTNAQMHPTPPPPSTFNLEMQSLDTVLCNLLSFITSTREKTF